MNLSINQHSGEIISSRALAEFHLTEVLYPPNFSIPSHLHRHACFGFVFQGSYQEVFREKTVECNPLQLIFRPAGEIHADRFGKIRTNCLLVEFETEQLKNLSRKLIKSDEPAVFSSNSLAWLMTKLRKEIQQPDDFTALIVEGLMLEIFAEAGRSSLKPVRIKQPDWLKQTREILHENFAGRFSLSKIAETVGVHPVYLAETFRRHHHCTVGEYIRRLRIEFASREISETDVPLAEIGLASGFSHQAHFSRTFKRLTGLTPAEFRANSRRKT